MLTVRPALSSTQAHAAAAFVSAPASSSPSDDTSLALLVEGIRNNDSKAMTALYERMQRGIRFLLRRQMVGRTEQVEDRIHDVFILTVEAIRADKVQHPERLGGFVRTIANRQACTDIRKASQQRKREVAAQTAEATVPCAGQTPEQQAISNEQQQRMRHTLQSLAPRDREILKRFYLNAETQQTICAEMGLTETQFRLCKSRAKARFGERARRAMALSVAERH